MQRRAPLEAVLALVGIAAVWGLSFPTMKSALEHVTPFQLLALRNLVGLAALSAIWAPGMWRDTDGRGKGKPLDARTARAGALLGLALAAGLSLQVVGLQTTTSVKAGFISGLYAVFTPFVAIPILQRKPAPPVIGAAAASAVGLFLLTVGDPKNLSSVALGDVLNLGAALAFAFHVAATGRYAPRLDYRGLCLVEAAVKAGFFSFAIPGIDLGVLVKPQVAVAVAVTGLGATALGLAIQTWAQRKVSASATAVILSSEPAFAGLFGFFLLGETLGPKGLLGAAMILAAMVVAGKYSEEGLVGATP